MATQNEIPTLSPGHATYARAYQTALFWLETSDLEIRSALKEAAAQEGIPYGDEMGKFVAWAEKRMGV